MKKSNFSLIAFKVDKINTKLEEDLKNIKIPEDIDKTVKNQIKALLDYIADDDILGEDRFNLIIEHLKTPCNLLHA